MGHPAFPTPSGAKDDAELGRCLRREELSSCPALCRASTSLASQARKTWMAGTKPGHDERGEERQRD
jgi:uncharacterized protein (UPF0548 family)